MTHVSLVLFAVTSWLAISCRKVAKVIITSGPTIMSNIMCSTYRIVHSIYEIISLMERAARMFLDTSPC